MPARRRNRRNATTNQKIVSEALARARQTTIASGYELLCILAPKKWGEMIGMKTWFTQKCHQHGIEV